MLKLFRNTLAERGCIFVPGFEKPAQWSHLQDLFNWEKENGFRAGSHLTAKHRHFKRYKMRVYLAAQLFSRSTADALDFLRIDLKIPEFADTAATAELCRRIDTAFDLLNARSPFAKGQKSSWDLENLEDKREQLLSFWSFCKELKLSSKQTLAHSQRKTCVVGFGTSIMSALGLAEILLKKEKNPLKKFYPYYTQQDFLEHFFSRIRQKCGSNSNPDVSQVIKKKMEIDFLLKQL